MSILILSKTKLLNNSCAIVEKNVSNHIDWITLEFKSTLDRDNYLKFYRSSLNHYWNVNTRGDLILTLDTAPF